MIRVTRRFFWVGAAIFILTAVSVISLNQYEYGLSDQAITVPFLKSFGDPSLYSSDYLVAQKDYYYSYLWPFLGLAVRYFSINIPLVFFLLYFFALFFFFLGIYSISQLLFRRREISFLALFFLLFFKPLLGGMASVDRSFLTRVAVLPILTFGLYYFLRRKYWLSCGFLGFGFLIHPLTAAQLAFILFFVFLSRWREIGWKKIAGCLILLAVLASPILAWKALHSPDSASLLRASPDWIKLLRLRSSDEIFPFSWPKIIFSQAMMVFLIFVLGAKFSPEKDYHRAVKIIISAVIIFCLLAAIFSEFLPLPIILNLQLFRSFQWLFYLAAIYFANYVFSQFSTGDWKDKIFVLALALGFFYGASNGGYGFACFSVLALLLILMKNKKKILISRYFTPALIILVLFLGGVLSFQNKKFTWQNKQEKDWQDIAVAARLSSKPDDFFIVPPNLEGFRVESERSIYGDWKDGTLTFYNPEFGREWFNRMEKLGYRENLSLKKSFLAMTESDFLAIASEIRPEISPDAKIFLVTMLGSKALNFPLVYQNQKFIVYALDF
ncbi:hypothetical protein COT68_00560 [bacterium (Candidatus Torokbacteria) CG09_land_8_20_14_0_10_42_11]|nr:MAG: hypothetical protein COT68_00560 [bacterium (Candidatus Torokbacteria) CG09_land_8_20_14_0_10_42_11]